MALKAQPAVHSVDGVPPSHVVRPSSAEELASTLHEADAAGRAVIPVGGGRALSMGDAPDRYDVALETAALNRILEHSVHDLTVTVEAGVQLEELQRQLRDAGQFLPLDPFASPGHTIGGLLASGWTGPLRLRYGSPRDFLIGLRVALPDGRLVRSGGKVVKNVSGYDLNKLHFGALGTLGVIVEASFKLFPKPFYEASVELASEDESFAWREAERALSLPQQPVALALIRRHDGLRALARFAGSEPAVRRMTAELGWQEAANDRWDDLARSDWTTWVRISTPPSALRPLLERVRGEVVALPGLGLAHWTSGIDVETLRLVRGAAEEAGGSTVILRGDSDLKAAVGTWGAVPPTMGLMRRVKEAFDPNHTLSPGRYVI